MRSTLVAALASMLSGPLYAQQYGLVAPPFGQSAAAARARVQSAPPDSQKAHFRVDFSATQTPLDPQQPAAPQQKKAPRAGTLDRPFDRPYEAREDQPVQAGIDNAYVPRGPGGASQQSEWQPIDESSHRGAAGSGAR